MAHPSPETRVPSSAAPRRGLLLCRNPQSWRELHSLWEKSERSSLAMAAYESPDSAMEAVIAHKPNICFLEIGSTLDCDIVERVAEAPVHVVALHSGANPDLILDTMRRGASSFLIHPCTAEQLQAALERAGQRLLRVSGAQRALGKVYCFIPAKGACGSTTVACNVAFALGRGETGQVLLADLDPLTGTLGFVLKLESQHSFVDALTHCRRMDEDLWKGMVTPYRGIDVLLSPQDPVDVRSYVKELELLVGYCRERYRTVVIDAPDPYGPWGLVLATCCDELLLVTTNELPALRSSQNALAYFARKGVDASRIKIVVNRYSTEIGIDSATIERALNHGIFHVVPSDYEGVQKALLEGKPVPSSTGVGRNIASLCALLTGRLAEPAKRSLTTKLLSKVGIGSRG